MLQQKPSISILTGIYNTPDPQILQKAVESIRQQTYTDWEWIICDDGSMDSTCETIQSLIQGDHRIRLIHNETNQGLAASLNHCLNYAKGAYIARMDADDGCEPCRLEKQVRFLEKHPDYELVGTAVRLFDEDGIWGKRKMPEIPEKRDFLWGSPFIHPSVMIRKQALLAVHGYRVAKETRRTEDYDLFMRLYEKGYQGYNLQEELYDFREDKNARKRKKYRYRIDEAKVRWKGFRLLGLMPKGVIYVLKPLIVGLIPYPVLVWLRGEKDRFVP